MEIDNRTKGELLDELNRLQLQVAQLESSKSIQHLQDEKTKFQSVIQTAPIIILRLSPDHRILEFNSEAERLYGYKREEVLGKDYLTLCIPEDIREEIARDIKKVLGGIPTREYENAVIAPDGQMRLLSWNVERILDSDNRPTGIVAVGLDVTAKMEKEKELAEARAFLQAAIEQTPAGVIIADAHEHKISVANSVARQMRAGDNEDVIGISIDDFQREVEVFDADGCRFRAEDFPMSRALRKGEATRDLEIKVCFRDREDLWILSNATPVRDTDNEIIGGVVVFSDITDRKRTEQVLQEKENILRVLFNAPTETMLMTSTEGIIQAINRIGADRLGQSVDELIGQNLFDILPPDVSRSRKAVFDELLATRKQVYIQDERDGIIFDINAYPIFDADGQVKAIAAYGRDITELKRTEISLRESEETFRQFAENSELVIWMYSLDEKQGLYFNPTWRRLLGDTVNESDVWSKAWFEFIHPDDREMYSQHHRQWIKNGRVDKYDIEYRMVCPDGDVLWVHDRTFSIRDDNGRIYRTAGLLDDITDRKRAEESLQRRLQFETLLAEMSTNFISLRPADIDAEINRTLHRLAEHVGVERCNIWQKHEEESFYTVSHSWTKPGFKSLSNMTSAEYPWYRDNMQIDQAIIVRNVNDIPSEALKDKKSFLNREAVSALAVPMAAQGSIIGVLSLTSMTKELEWPPGLVKRVKLIAEVITNALLNRRANKAVMETTHQLKAEREQLEKKNIALKQILNHMDQKKTDFKNEICESVENLLMPTIIKLLKNDGCLSGKDLDILQHNLDSIIGRDLNQFKNNYKTLTARELDICKGVREGMSSKEIANMLCISPETVQKHRESTRRKLQIKHRSINLTTFLRTKLNDQD